VEHASEEGNVKGDFYSLFPNYPSTAASLQPLRSQAAQYLSLSAASPFLVTDGGYEAQVVGTPAWVTPGPSPLRRYLLQFG